MGDNMTHIETQSEYDTVVQGLIDELSAEFADIDTKAISENIANQVLMGLKIQHGKPVTIRAITYEGGSLDTLDTALHPGDVLQYTHAENIRQPTPRKPSFRQAAVAALAEDIVTTYRQSYQTEDPQNKLS
jgi:hypothetical protein